LELELFWFEPWGAAEAVDDACTVETAFGVASGESPALCAAAGFQLPAVVTSRYAQWGTRVPPGIDFGYVEAATLGQSDDHADHNIQLDS